MVERRHRDPPPNRPRCPYPATERKKLSRLHAIDYPRMERNATMGPTTNAPNDNRDPFVSLYAVPSPYPSATHRSEYRRQRSHDSQDERSDFIQFNHQASS